ncbi:hypothetical protein EVAR_38031_1 [Eumeta japonica]|uniref:Uncharacterized protein n=1 Tax=Eumeta variegata TaxID=151549 RepID=A0A4C1WAU2_EUMVA|nr:hypothetical protein EVAR_38031_1 [Eumeta japonica]
MSRGGARCDIETGLCTIQRELVKKRLAMNLAEMEAATKFDEADEHAVHQTEDSVGCVDAWIESTPPVVNAINAAANQAEIFRREGVTDDAARTTLSSAIRPNGKHSSERGRNLTEFTDAINKLARPRPIPYQKVQLKIVPATIRVADKEIKVHSLLDDSATVTLLDDSVAREINAKGPRTKMKLISARGHQISDRNSRRVKIRVRGPNSVERDIQYRTIARLDLPSHSFTAAFVQTKSPAITI